MGSVHLLFHSTGVENILAEFDGFGSQCIPISLEEKRVDTTRARWLFRIDGEDKCFDFFGGRDELQMVVVLLS